MIFWQQLRGLPGDLTAIHHENRQYILNNGYTLRGGLSLYEK